MWEYWPVPEGAIIDSIGFLMLRYRSKRMRSNSLLYLSFVISLSVGIIGLFHFSGNAPHDIPIIVQFEEPLEPMGFVSYGCTGCPEIAAIMADPCRGTSLSETDNEFLIISAGCGFAVNDLVVDFDASNNIISSVNDDIGLVNCPFQTPSGALITTMNTNSGSCTSITGAGPGSTIPAGAIVIVLTDASGLSSPFDWSALCGTGRDVYVLQNSCDRSAGAFSNYSIASCPGVSGSRTTGISTSGCSDAMIYDRCNLTTSDPDLDISWVYDDGTGTVNYSNVDNICQPSLGLPNYDVSCMSFDPAEMGVSGVNCFGDTTGAVLAGVQNGTPPYNYDWDWDGTGTNDDLGGPPSTTDDAEDLINLPAGMYCLTVTDADGCTIDTCLNVTTQPAKVITMSDMDLLCFGDMDGTASVVNVTGAPVTNYEWSTGAMGPGVTSVSGLGGGWVYVTVTDIVGCSQVDSTFINEPPDITASVTGETLLCTGDSDGDIDLTASGGTGGLIFDWDWDGTGANDDLGGPPSNTDDAEDPSNLEAGTYTVTITDANGCTETASVIIGEPAAAVTASATGSMLTCFGDMNGTIDLTPGGGTGAYSYDWDNDGTGDNDDSQDLSGLGAGTYNVTVTDINGCTAIASATISGPAMALTGTETYSGCQGDGYSVMVGPTTYNEGNPSGVEVLTNGDGCDSTVTVTLNFSANSTGSESYTGCTGDGYSVNVGGTLYNEGNPSGMETLVSGNGCDSVVTVTLTFNSPTTGNENYTGCAGDGYSVTVGGTLYNEGNPSGMETLTGANNCDSVVTVSLTFNANTTGNENYTGCAGDGYSVNVGGTIYNEGNPSGTETLMNGAGCDSVVTVALTFNANTTGNENYTGCTGDGYSVTVGGTLYNEGNPSGTETLMNGAGCDSVVTVALTFNGTSTGNENYTGCTGDGYSVTVGGTLYNEGNPSGTETLMNGAGCDSIVTVALTF